MMTSRFRTIFVLIGGALLLASSAHAQTSQACASAKQKALGKTASSALACHSKAAKAGITVDPLCLQKADDKWQIALKGAHPKAEAKGGCALEGQNFVLEGRCSHDATAICSSAAIDCNFGTCSSGTCTLRPAVTCTVNADCLGTCGSRNDTTEAQGLFDLVVDESASLDVPSPTGLVDRVVPLLRPNPAANPCQASKLAASGKLASALLACHSKAAKKSLPVDANCLAKATGKHTSAFTKAETKPPCDTTGDAGLIQTQVGPFVELAVKGIPRNDGCGSGVVLAPETCDDGNTVNTDDCPADCVVDTCTPNGGSDDPWTVSFTSAKPVGAITVFVDYPEAKISILGSGNVPEGSEIDGIVGSPFTAASFNDRDHGLTAALAEGTGSNFGLTGALFTVHFETCAAAGAAAAGDFTCTVLGAADATGKALTGVTCSVN